MIKGDIVLIPSPFTDLSGNKNLPALILIVSEEDVTFSFISTQFGRQTESDLPIIPSAQNGLKKDSLIKLNKFATIDRDLILGRLGTLEHKFVKQVNLILTKILKLLD